MTLTIVESRLAIIQRYYERHKRPLKKIQLITSDTIFLYPDYRRVFVDDAEIQLRKKEFDILQYLMTNRGIVISHEQLFNHVWGMGYDEASPNLLWNQISRLRSKLSLDGKNIDCIDSIKDVGYRFR